jgi:phage-related protein
VKTILAPFFLIKNSSRIRRFIRREAIQYLAKFAIANLINAIHHLAKFAIANLINSIANLINSIANLIDSIVNLIKEESNLVPFLFYLIKFANTNLALGY